MTEPLKGEVKEQVVELAIGDVVPSRQMRKKFDEAALKELADSIADIGVQQPILVRRTEGEFVYSIVFGERRWRASQLAGKKTIPAIVREMTDQEVWKAQYAENDKRQDLSVLEDAEALREAVEVRGLTVDEICKELGKSRSHVFGRLRLARLVGPAREALESGKIPQTIAGLAAQLPGKELQAKFVQQVIKGDWSGPLSFDASQELLNEEYIRQLDARSPAWDLKEEGLVKGCDSCAACPKRSGNIAEFEDRQKRPNVCTDVLCYEQKRKAATERVLKEAEKNGQKVYREEQWTKNYQLQGACVKLSDECYEDSKDRTYKELIGEIQKKHGDPVPVCLAATRAGVIEVVNRNELHHALQRCGVIARNRHGAGSGSAEANYKKEMEKRRAEDDAEMAAVVAAAEKAKLEEGFIRELVSGAMDVAGHYTLEGIARRRGMKKKGTDWNQTLEDFVVKAKQPELVGLLVECLGNTEEFAAFFKVDLKEAVKRAKQQAAEAKAMAEACKGKGKKQTSAEGAVGGGKAKPTKGSGTRGARPSGKVMTQADWDRIAAAQRARWAKAKAGGVK